MLTNFVTELAVIVKLCPAFASSSTVNLHKFISICSKKARKVTVSKFRPVFKVMRVCLVVCSSAK